MNNLLVFLLLCFSVCAWRPSHTLHSPRLSGNSHRGLLPFSDAYAPRFKAAALDDEPQPELASEDKYTIAKARQDVINIEVNMYCYVIGMCYYNEARFESISSDRWFNTDKSLDYFLAAKELLEAKYGSRFSHPIEKQDDEYNLREGLRKRFISAVNSIGKQWEQLSDIKWRDIIVDEVPYNSAILSRYKLYKVYEAYFQIMDTKSMETAVEKIEAARDRYYVPSASNDFFAQASYDHLASDGDLKQTYRTSVDVSEAIAGIQLTINRLFGYIFSAKPSLQLKFVTLDKIPSMTVKDAAFLVGFNEALEQLYDGLIDNEVPEGSFAVRHHKAIYTKLYNYAKDIHTYWWNQAFLLAHKNRNIQNALTDFEYMAWIKAVFAPMEHIDELEHRLKEFRDLTLAGTNITKIQID